MGDAGVRLEAVVDVFARLGIEIREERLGGTGGGLCTLRGKSVLFVDLDADIPTRLERSLAALAAVPDLDAVYLMPAIREALERCADAESG